MARTAAATALMVATILSLGSTARGQPSGGVDVQDADEAPPPEQPRLAAPVLPALTPCCCCGMASIGPSEPELTAVIAGGSAAAIMAYVFAAVYANAQPHSVPAIEGIPVAGAIVAAVRNPADDRGTPLLLFSAGVQAIGILVAAVTGADLAERRRLNLEVAPCAGGGAIGVTWRY